MAELRSVIGNAIRYGFIFALCGPPIGGLAMLLFLMASEGKLLPVIHPTYLAIVMLFSYLLGAVPAALVGVVVGVFRARIDEPYFGLKIGVISMLTSYAYFALLFLSSRHFSKNDFNLRFIGFGLAGFVSGVVLVRVLKGKRSGPDAQW